MVLLLCELNGTISREMKGAIGLRIDDTIGMYISGTIGIGVSGTIGMNINGIAGIRISGSVNTGILDVSSINGELTLRHYTKKTRKKNKIIKRGDKKSKLLNILSKAKPRIVNLANPVSLSVNHNFSQCFVIRLQRTVARGEPTVTPSTGS